MDLQTLATTVPLAGWAIHGGILARRLQAARRDPLTGLHTRAGWTVRAQRIIRQHSRAVVLLVDLNDFKALNDTYGHAAGDAALVATANRLASWCGRNGVAGRLGGDEFVAVVSTPATTTGLAALRTDLHRPISHDGHRIPVAASIGVCHVDQLSVPALTDALSAADAAMYAAKNQGRRNNR